MKRASQPDLLVLYLVGAGLLWPDFFRRLGEMLPVAQEVVFTLLS